LGCLGPVTAEVIPHAVRGRSAMSKPALVSRVAVCVTLRRSRLPEQMFTYEHWFLSACYPYPNMAGNRESSNPGIGDRAERLLVAVFRQLARG
jgi:hypothetical protein